MKKISTLGFGILLSFASFANFAPNRLTVSAEDNASIKVTVDGSRFDQQNSNSTVFENLNPGYHSVKVYQLQDRRGWFGRGRTDDYCLVYTTSVNIKPLFETSIVVNKFGRAYIDEQPMRGGFNNRGWDNDNRKDNDWGYGNDNGRHNDDYGKDNNGRNNSYNNNRNDYDQLMNNDDFFAIKRMLERESFDNTRLVIAKHIVDVNTLSSIQVKEMAQFFSFDDSKLDFVKYAYNKTIDKNNYTVVFNVFSYSSSKEQLMDYIRSCR